MLPSSIHESTGKATGAIRPVNADQVKVCDFRSSGSLDASRLAPLAAANEAFARSLGEAFSVRFDIPCEIAVSSLDVAVCETFIDGSAATPTYLHSLILGSHAETGILQMEAVVMLVLLDCLLGGSGKSAPTARDLTEIESQMANEIVKIVAQELQKAWRASNIEVKVGSRQTPELLLQTLPPSATALVPTLTVNIAEVNGKFQLLLPIPSIAPFLKAPTRSTGERATQASSISPRLATDLQQARFPLELVVTEGKVLAGDIMNLAVGQVLRLGTPAGNPAVASIGGKAVFSALPVRSGDNRAAHVLERIMPDAESTNSSKTKENQQP